MTHASLFSGIGGAELAAAWMGWTNAFHCEINPFARKVLKHHFPNSISYEDITKTDFTPWRGRVDILTGGFPCQPFSVSGKRKGAADDRYLWPQMLRAIREIQPSWVVGENVAGLFSMVQPGEEINMGRSEHLFEENYLVRREQEFTLHAILDNLEQAGYAVQTFVIPACAVGAPHRRDRVWIVAHRADAGVESVQREWKDGVFEPRFTPNTDISRCERRCGQECEEWKGKKEERSNVFRISERPCGVQPSSHTKRIGRNEVFQEIQSEVADGQGINSLSSKRPSSHTKGSRSSGQLLEKQRKKEPYGRDCRKSISDFSNFPTQSPICRGNDGLSDRLDTSTISFPKWREESVKAYGNAWVPQVAYEIFKAIEEVFPIL